MTDCKKCFYYKKKFLGRGRCTLPEEYRPHPGDCLEFKDASKYVKARRLF